MACRHCALLPVVLAGSFFSHRDDASDFAARLADLTAERDAVFEQASHVAVSATGGTEVASVHTGKVGRHAAVEDVLPRKHKLFQEETEEVAASARIGAQQLVGEDEVVDESLVDMRANEDSGVKVDADVEINVGVGSQMAGDPPAKLNLFHINLSWECMSLQTKFGSGKYAAKHCQPGTAKIVDGPIAAPPNRKIELKWTEFTDTPPQSLVTSCSHFFLKELEKWQQTKQYDVLTLVEMANPGEAGYGYLGRTSESFNVLLSDERRAMLNTGQQVDPIIYQYLKDNILGGGYDVFTNIVVQGIRAVTSQATFWKKESFGDAPTLAIGTAHGQQNMDRPISALFFAEYKTLVLNVHGVHFRKELIAEGYKNFGPEMDAVIKQTDCGGNYGVKDCPGKDLRDLYGKWLTHQITTARELCNDDNMGVYCAGTDLGWELPATLAGWTVLVHGDFNDELQELGSFDVFGVTVGVPQHLRKRTCCSDRDPDFTAFYDAGENVRELRLPRRDASREPMWYYESDGNKRITVESGQIQSSEEFITSTTSIFTKTNLGYLAGDNGRKPASCGYLKGAPHFAEIEAALETLVQTVQIEAALETLAKAGLVDKDQLLGKEKFLRLQDMQEYLLKGGEGADKYLLELGGADKEIPGLIVLGSENDTMQSAKSMSTFSSDMILVSSNYVDDGDRGIFFPDGYKQIMSGPRPQFQYATTGRGMISDHDPIERALIRQPAGP